MFSRCISFLRTYWRRFAAAGFFGKLGLGCAPLIVTCLCIALLVPSQPSADQAAALIGPTTQLADRPNVTSTITATAEASSSSPVSTTPQDATPTNVPTIEPTPGPSRDPLAYPVQPEGLVPAQVVDVIDGDTVDVQFEGKVERLRLIGIDTPETKDPRKPVQCFGQEATAQAEALLNNQIVFLEADSSQDSRDTYDRLLRYVWLPDGKLFNLEMIIGGFAHEYTYDMPYKYQAVFQTHERGAEERGWGFWSPTSCNGNTEQAADMPGLTEAPVPPPVDAPTSGGPCEPSYPDVCIPPVSVAGDLDCGDIAEGRFRVLPPDPHGFDGRDNDGLGCERN